MSLRRFDVFPKLDNEFRVGTTAGGILSLCSLVAAIVLSYVEIYSYLHPPVRQRLSVDAVRPTELDGVTISSRSQPRFDVNLDVTFPEAPCYLLHIDVLDSITQLPLPPVLAVPVVTALVLIPSAAAAWLISKIPFAGRWLT